MWVILDEDAVEPTANIQEISDLRESFSKLAFSFCNELVVTRTHAEDFRKHVAALPLSLNSRINFPISKSIDDVENLNTLTNLFYLLNANVWNFFDYQVLQYVITKFGSDAIQGSMREYISNFKEFEETTTLHDIFEHWPGQMQKLPGYAEVIVNLDGDPKQCTLAHLNMLRHHICARFLPPLSEYAMRYCKHRKDNFQVIWILPSDLAVKLRQVVGKPESQDFLRMYQTFLSIKLDSEFTPGIQ